ncbi:MAG: MotA/TolQ/ExbB proton channel family protein [Alphaproteobacteria bacterium]
MEPTTPFEQASLMEIVVAAPLAVQLVMGLLVLLSIVTWVIVFDKGYRLWVENRQAISFEDKFAEIQVYNELLEHKDTLGSSSLFMVYQAGMEHWGKSSGGTWLLKSQAQIRNINRRMNDQLNRQMAKLERQMIILASIGTAAPFIGLFGTVWGVMNAFMGIAATGNTTLDVVAPGIAEALLATALGLVAAIPASVAYNKFSNDLGLIASKMEGFIDQFSSELSDSLEAGG